MRWRDWESEQSQYRLESNYRHCTRDFSPRVGDNHNVAWRAGLIFFLLPFIHYPITTCAFPSLHSLIDTSQLNKIEE